MTTWNWLKGAAITLAAIGTVVPAPQLQAAQGTAPLKIETTEATVLDIAMSEGVFVGRVVDHAGHPVAGAEVSLSQGKAQVAKTVTDQTGAFAVNDLKGGVYEVRSGKTAGNFRIWTETTAPESAKEQALVILGENGTRGSIGGLGGGTLVLTAAVIASLIITGISLNRLNDLQDDVNKIPKSP